MQTALLRYTAKFKRFHHNTTTTSTNDLAGAKQWIIDHLEIDPSPQAYEIIDNNTQEVVTAEDNEETT
jgi:hypothetical protein